MPTYNRPDSSIEVPNSLQDWNPPDLELELFEEDETVQWGTEREEEGSVEDSPARGEPQPKPRSRWQRVRPWLIAGASIFVGVNLGVEGLRALGNMVSCGGIFHGNSGARQFVGMMNRQQQAEFLERGKFVTSLDPQRFPGPKSFDYALSVTPQAAFTFATPSPKATEKAHFGLFEWDRSSLYRLKAYVGAVYVVPDTKVKAKPSVPKPMTMIAITCEAIKPGAQALGRPTLKGNQPLCPEGTIKLSS